MVFVDTHIHLTDRRFEADLDAVLERSRAAGVTAWMTIGTSPFDADAAAALAERVAGVFFAAGMHPHHAADWNDGSAERLRAILSSPRALALGEIGLDYHYDFAPREVQRRVFEAQLGLAIELDRPIVIHCREAFADIASVLRAHRDPRLRGVFHCFSEGRAEAEEAVDLGFCLGLGGVVTFANSGAVREAVRHAPACRLLLETDAPYLAPVPKRGRRNEPSYIPYIAEVVARERGETIDAVAAITTANAQRLLGLLVPGAPVTSG